MDWPPALALATRHVLVDVKCCFWDARSNKCEKGENYLTQASTAQNGRLTFSAFQTSKWKIETYWLKHFFPFIFSFHSKSEPTNICPWSTLGNNLIFLWHSFPSSIFTKNNLELGSSFNYLCWAEINDKLLLMLLFDNLLIHISFCRFLIFLIVFPNST